MPSSALRSFVHGFNSPGITRNTIYIPAFLVPTVIKPNPSTLPKAKLLKIQGCRRNASSSVPDTASTQIPFNVDDGSHDIRLGSDAVVSPKHRREPGAWAGLIEAYLPLHLRQGGQNIVETLTQFTNLHSIYTLPLLLSRARVSAKVDLLSYLGVFQGRWEAVIWLVKAMMEYYPGLLREEQESRQLPNLFWPIVGQSLDNITEKAVETAFPQQSKASLDSLTQNTDFNPQRPAINFGRQALGQIWQSLGTMILQAADRSAEDPSYSVIMSHVFRILAHLHHIEAFPNSIYNYTPAMDQAAVQRPPTLHLLSRRIMSTLSDLEWGLQWQEEISKYQKLGYDLPKATVPPKIREFGPELWLDLVLWACVEGGWVTEGAWIVTEMERRKGSTSKWSVISWQDVCAIKEPKIDWASIMKLQIERTRLNQVGGIGIATGPDSTVDMGERTVSREVILAIMDGLLNTPSPQSSAPGLILSNLQQSIQACKNLLERHYPQLDNNFVNANILRIMESVGWNPQDMPGLLQRLLNLRDLKTKGIITNTNISTSVQDLNTDDSAALLGLLHRNLNSFAQEDNVQGSLSTFRQIQDLVDQKRNNCIQDFADELKARIGQGHDDKDLIVREDSNTATVHLQIPVSALVTLLDLVTDSKLYDLGKWLLSNEDVDGGAIDPELYSDPNLQPALLRFATATADNNLLTKVLERLGAPLPEPILHALLRCQIALGKWEAVEDLLGHFQKTPNMAWAASDATAIARAILQMEHGPSDPTTQEQIVRSHGLLQDLVRGKYNTAYDPSQPPDFSQIRLANQLRRIFRSLPGSLSKNNTDPSGDTERANASISVTPNSFNILVETIVECYGPKAGKKLWEQWCRDPGEAKLAPYIRKSHIDEKVEPVVTPTLYLLRNILQPILLVRQGLKHGPHKEAESDINGREADAVVHAPSSSNSDASAVTKQQEEQSIVEWGISMFRKFGLSEKEINREIPGTLPRKIREGKLGDLVEQ